MHYALDLTPVQSVFSGHLHQFGTASCVAAPDLDDICLGQFGIGGTWPPGMVGPLPPVHISHIVQLRSGSKMAGIAAGRVVTGVPDH